MLDDPGDGNAKRVVGAQVSHFEASSVTTRRFTSGLDNRLMELKSDLESTVSGPVLLTVHLKELLDEAAIKSS